MTQDIDPKLYDKRTYERMIRDGLLTQEQHNQYLQSLPDLTPNMEEEDDEDEEEDYEEEEDENDAGDTEEDA